MREFNKSFQIIGWATTIYTLYFLIFSYQWIYTIKNYYSHEIELVLNNLKSNYIINVRIIDSREDCEKNEVVLSLNIQEGGKEYTLNELSYDGSFNSKQIFKLCQEVHIDYNFEYLYNNQQYSDLLDDVDVDDDVRVCKYYGLKIKSITNKCPISDIIFSHSEDERSGYEKISKNKESTMNFFIKRSDEQSTPLTAIQIIKNKQQLSFSQTSLNMTFSMTNVCKEQYGIYQPICSNSTLRNELEYKLVKDNQIALDANCHNSITTFNRIETKHNFYLAFFAALFFTISLSFLIFICLFQIVREPISEQEQRDRGNLIFILKFILHPAIFLLSPYWKYRIYSQINYFTDVISSNCYKNVNPLEYLLNDLKVQNILLLISIGYYLILICIRLVLLVVPCIQKKLQQRYQRFSNQEMIQI